MKLRDVNLAHEAEIDAAVNERQKKACGSPRPPFSRPPKSYAPQLDTVSSLTNQWLTV